VKNSDLTVSIVIPCRNEAGRIRECVGAALAQLAGNNAGELIIADGVSDDGTRKILESLEREEPRVRLIDNPGRIVSTGLNAAIRAARGQIIIRMDAHTEYAPDYVARCVELLEKTGADNVGGPWLAKGDGYVSRAIAAAFQSSFAVGGARGHDVNHEGPVDTVYLGCWSKETFERFGYFDEELVRNQDDEHNLRIIRGGGKIYQSPKVRSWYRPRGTLAALFKQYLQYGYWKVRVIQKHKQPASPRHLVPGGFVLALAILAILSPIFHPPFIALLLALGSYVLALLAASLVTAARTGIALLPVLPAAFCCYHFGYGFGFLRGLLDFVILRRGASASFTKLTRGSPEVKALEPAQLP